MHDMPKKSEILGMFERLAEVQRLSPQPRKQAGPVALGANGWISVVLLGLAIVGLVFHLFGAGRGLEHFCAGPLTLQVGDHGADLFAQRLPLRDQPWRLRIAENVVDRIDADVLDDDQFLERFEFAVAETERVGVAHRLGEDGIFAAERAE